MMNLLKFSAEWCGPCKALKPVVEELVKEDKYKDSVQLIEVDIEGEDIIPEFNVEPNDLVLRYMVRNVPTLIAVNEEGREIGRKVGNLPKSELENFLDSSLANC